MKRIASSLIDIVRIGCKVGTTILNNSITMAKSSIVLSFYEILLRESDIALLTGPYWLNDTIISFYFEYLEKVMFNNAPELLFVSPEVTQCIKMVPADEIGTFLEPLDIASKNFLFFALNDNDSPDTAGGSHWSLLVYSNPEACFYHLDSSKGHNHYVAWEFASHLMSYFARTGSVNFINKDCVQQTNGYDCGVHLILNAERLAEWAINQGVIGMCDVEVQVNATTKRKEILKIIQTLSSAP